MQLKKTSQLTKEHVISQMPVPHADSSDMGLLRPWRIALIVKQMQVELVCDLTKPLVIGRADPENQVFPDVDLRPFSAEDLGVSRNHLVIHLDGDRVVVMDNKSSNGTRINQRWIEADRLYTIQHGDDLTLGAMELQVELLVNPLD